MPISEKQSLYHLIDNLSDEDCGILLKICGDLFSKNRDLDLGELPRNETNHNLKILKDMHKGKYFTLAEIKRELGL